MSELKTIQREKLSKYQFGIPSLRKYPLNDEEHVRKAIQMFHHCPYEYKKELAKNIYKFSHNYNIEINSNSPIYEYLPKKLQEDIQFIFIDEEWDKKLENTFNILESIAKENADAATIIEVAIGQWKMQKKLVTNIQQKNSLLVKVNSEKNIIDSYIKNNDFDGVINRAKMTTKKIQRGGFIPGQQNNNSYLGKAMNTLTKQTNSSEGVIRQFGRSAVKSVTKKAAAGAVVGGVVAGPVGAVVGGVAGAAVPKHSTAIMAGVDTIKRVSNNSDPNSPLKHESERYLRFLENFADELKEFNPFKKEGD